MGADSKGGSLQALLETTSSGFPSGKEGGGGGESRRIVTSNLNT